MASVGDKYHLHPLLVGLLHPFEHLIVEDAFFGSRSKWQEFPEQEVLVEPICLVLAPLWLRLLAAMPRIGEDDGVADLRLAHEILPCSGDALLACIRIDQTHHLLGAGSGQRLGHVLGVVGCAVEIVALSDIVVDADHESIKLGRAHRRGRSEEEHESERSGNVPVPHSAFAQLNHATARLTLLRTVG